MIFVQLFLDIFRLPISPYNLVTLGDTGGRGFIRNSRVVDIIVCLLYRVPEESVSALEMNYTNGEQIPSLALEGTEISVEISVIMCNR